MSSPMSLVSLPEDLLLHIFTIILDLDDHSEREPSVLILSSVCTILRKLVVNSPTLWSHIRLKSLDDLDGAHLFLMRSGTCLLDISIFSAVFDVIGFPDRIQTYAPLRWRSLSLFAPASHGIAQFMQAIATVSTPLLRHVQFLPQWHHDHGETHLRVLSGASESLSTLLMKGCIGCLPPLPNLIRANLFQLRCRYEEFRDFIQGSPNLNTLILDRLVDPWDWDPDNAENAVRHPLIEVPSLRSLAVGFTSVHLMSPIIRPLLSFLSAPNLEYLEVIGSRSSEYGELAGKSFPALRSLCLRDMHFPNSEPTVYRSWTKISRLELIEVQGAQLLLAPDEGGALPWPELEVLVCRFSAKDEDFSFLKLLDGRARLTILVSEQSKHEPIITRIVKEGTHVVRFCSQETSALIRKEDFARAEWDDDEDDHSDHDFTDDALDAFGAFDEEYDFDYEYDMEIDEEEDYFEDDDDDWNGYL